MQSSRSAGNHHRPSRRCRSRGNPKTQLRRRRRARSAGQLADQPAGRAGRHEAGATRRSTARRADGAKVRGDPEIHRRRQPEGEETGATPGNRRETLMGAGSRGNPETRRRERRRTRETGQPGARAPATANEGAGGGETRRPIEKAEGDEDPMSCKDIRKAPGTQVSGAFDFGRIFLL